MVDRDVEEHRAEISRQNKTTPMIVVVVMVAVIAVVFFTRADDPSVSESAPPTSVPTPPTTAATTTVADDGVAEGVPFSAEPPIVGLATTDDDTFVFGSVTSPLTPLRPQGTLALVEAMVVTGDHIAIIDTDGRLVEGTGDGVFEPVTCCHDTIVASNEPGHVWAVDVLERAVLVDLDRGPTGVELALDGERVIGLGTFGLVTADGRGHATWRRPGFDPTPVVVPDGRMARTSGGKLIAYVTAETEAVEVRRIVDGALVRSFPLQVPFAANLSVRLSTSGDAIAITQDGTAVVFDVEDGTPTGALRLRDAGPVPVGGGRFAIVAGVSILDSKGRRIALAADPKLLATRAE